MQGQKRLKSYYKSTCKNIRSHDFEKSWRWVNLECPMYRRNPGIIPLLNNRREVRSSPWNICKASCKTKINSLAGGIFVDVENAKLTYCSLDVSTERDGLQRCCFFPPARTDKHLTFFEDEPLQIK